MRDAPGRYSLPLIWNLAFNELLDDFQSGPAQVKDFADETVIVLRGQDIYTFTS